MLINKLQSINFNTISETLMNSRLTEALCFLSAASMLTGNRQALRAILIYGSSGVFHARYQAAGWRFLQHQADRWEYSLR